MNEQIKLGDFKKKLTPEERAKIESFTPGDFIRNRRDFNRLPEDYYYAMINWKELLAVTFSNQDFQDTLSKIKVENQKPSFFKRMIDTVLEALGMKGDQDTALVQIMSEALKVIQDGQPLRSSPISFEANPTLQPDIEVTASPVEITPEDLRGITVKLKGMLPSGAIGSYEMDAEQALKELDAEITLYEKIKACVSK
jgi:hypothetical protein